MPVLNGGQHLRLAVLSIIGQTFRDWEMLIIDDGSTDNALQGIADIHDRRIRILRDGKNKGLAARLNEAIDLARGEYFARMDHDDVSYPARFIHQLALLESNPELDVVAVRAITISDDNVLVGSLPYSLSHPEICARPWQGFYLPHPTWMGRISWFRAHQYALPGPYFCEDQEILLRGHARSRFATVDRILFAYRIRNTINSKKQAKTRWALLKIQWCHFYNSKQFHFIFFAWAVFVGRIASDLLKIIRQTLLGDRNLRVAVDSVCSTEWQDVLKQILRKC